MGSLQFGVVLEKKKRLAVCDKDGSFLTFCSVLTGRAELLLRDLCTSPMYYLLLEPRESSPPSWVCRLTRLGPF